MATERVFLRVLRSENSQVFQLGAKFDWPAKKWYVPAGLDLDLFARWIPGAHAPTTPVNVCVSSATVYMIIPQILPYVEPVMRGRYRSCVAPKDD